MSTEQEQIKSLAERVARRLSENNGGSSGVAARAQQPGGDANDLFALRQALGELRERLAHLESHVAHDETCATSGGGGNNPPRVSAPTPVMRPTLLSSTYVPATGAHPSQERFDVSDAVSELVDFFEREKTCNLEPGGKPCDQCAMCSSRGF